MLKEVKKELHIKDIPSASPKMPTESTAVEETTVVMVESEDQIADDRTDMDEFCNSIRESSAFDNDSIMELQTMVMPTPEETTKAEQINLEQIELIEAALGITPATVSQRTSKGPYQVVVDNLRMVEFEFQPIAKLRVMAQSSNLIVQSIDNFWQGVTYLPHEKLKKKLALDAEQMILICIYITLRA